MEKLIVSSSPHMKGKNDTKNIMADVIIALCPALFAGIYFFGFRALAVVLTAICAAVLSEYFYNKIAKKPQTVGDLSAVVTGLLLGLNMPSTIPLYMVVIGSCFAIIIVKQLYGGIGKNFMNPALAARCFMLVAWAGAMSNFAAALPGDLPDTISSATPLAVLKGTSPDGVIPELWAAFFGNRAGCIGETSGLALLIGFTYLLIKRVVDLKIPVALIATFAIFMFLFGTNPTRLSDIEFTLMHIVSGGLLIGALFMATDYVTTPTTFWGQIIFGMGCGFLTFAIRKFGAYPEGVSFAIIIMNVVTPIIERFTRPRPFGEVKRHVK